jgi:hypothetical protein
MRRLLLCAVLLAATTAPAAHAQGEAPNGPWDCKWEGRGALLSIPGEWDHAMIIGEEAVYGTDGTPAHDIVLTCSLQTEIDFGTGTQLGSATSAPGYGVAVIPGTIVKLSEPQPRDFLLHICEVVTWTNADGTPGSFVYDNSFAPGVQCI